MKIQLIAATSPLVRTEDNTRNLTIEEFIVYCARVSNPSNQLNTNTAAQLLKYCIQHEHWSIFEQASLTFQIQTSRDISAQIIRHKSFSFQEFSQRYSISNSLESFDIRKQAVKNRQSSSDLLDISEENLKEVISHLQNSVDLYNKLISLGAAKECARKILPLCTQTTLYMTGSLRSWIHYLNLRCKQDTQLEHREIALAIKKIFSDLLPAISEALSWKETNIDLENLDEEENDPHLNAITWGARSTKTPLSEEFKNLTENAGKNIFKL